MQRNAIAMLHDRVLVVLQYISAVADGKLGGGSSLTNRHRQG